MCEFVGSVTKVVGRVRKNCTEEKSETKVRNGSLNPFEGSSKVQEDSDQRSM